MKKILLLVTMIFFGSTTFAQSASEPVVEVPKIVETTKEQTTLETAAKNIDRRLAYFTEYKQNGDIDNLSKLVSEKNKSFYTSFIKYVRLSLPFTLKRNTTGKIVKTPSGEYFVPSILIVDGQEKKKISINFIEEKTEKGTRWLIVNSTLHVQSGTTAPNNNLGSNTLNTGNNNPKTGGVTNTASKPIATLPQKKSLDTPGEGVLAQEEVDESKVYSNFGMPLIVTLLILSLGTFIFWIIMLIDAIRRDFDKKSLWIIMMIFLGLPASIAYYFIVKKRKVQKLVAATSAATVLVAASEGSSEAPSIPSVPPIHTTAEGLVTSNVNISTVEAIHANEPISPITAETPLAALATQEAPKNTPIIEEVATNSSDVSKQITSLTDDTQTSDTDLGQEMVKEPENMILTPKIEVETIKIESNVVPEPLIPPHANIIPEAEPETQGLESPISDIFLTPPEEDPVIVEQTENSQEISGENISQVPGETHPLFEGIFEPKLTESESESIDGTTPKNT